MKKGSGAYHSNGSENKNDYVMETEPSIRINTPNSNEYYPVKTYILFDQIKFEPILKKLKEFQQQISAEHKNELITDKNHIELIEHLMNNHENLKVASQLNDQIDLLFQMIEVWPKGKLYQLSDLPGAPVRPMILNFHSILIFECLIYNGTYLLI
jgi:hypothetical protein